MKQIIILTVLFCVWLVNGISAQNDTPNPLLTGMVKSLDESKSPEELKKVRASFERLSSLSESGWLPLYYMAYIDIELSFVSPGETDKNQYLEEAGNYLDKLKKLKVKGNHELSEINALRGYWYFAHMAINPGVNGPKYASLTINAFSEALRLNPDNPRAILLNAFFQHNMAKFTGGEYGQLNQDIQKAGLLFDKETTDSPLPHWRKNLH